MTLPGEYSRVVDEHLAEKDITVTKGEKITVTARKIMKR